MEIHRRLTVHITNLNRSTASELIIEFSKIEGVLNPGVDEHAAMFVTVYDPEIVSKDQLLQKLHDLGYQYDHETDHEF